MSCPAEEIFSVYVDRELPADQVRLVEAHLIQCQRCRGLVLALGDEARLLSDMLQMRLPAARRRVAPRARARGLALGLVPTLALGALGFSLAGWLLDQRLPGFSWMHPSQLIGAYEMAFDTIFTLRDALPVLFDLGVAVGATAAMAAVLTFFVSALLRRAVGNAATSLVVLAALGAVWGPAAPSRALDVRWDEQSVEIARDAILEDTLMGSAEHFEIDGTLRGDLLALAERVSIRGRVEGNVFVAAREVLITGTIDGSLHIACERCNLEGTVNGNLYAAGENVTLAQESRIGRDAHVVGAGLRVDGATGRDLSAAGKWIELRGDVARDARTHSEQLTVFDEARVGRNLVIEIAEHGESQVSDRATIGGELSETVVEHHGRDEGSPWLDGGFYLRSLVYLVSAFLMGLLLHAIVPSLFWGTLETPTDYLRCLGIGFVTVVVLPIVLVLCAITVVGIPLAILGGFAYLTLFFVSTIVVAALVGAAITGSEPESAHGFGLALLLGLVLVLAATNLPFVGGLLRVLVSLAGFGLIVAAGLEAWRNRTRAYA